MTYSSVSWPGLMAALLLACLMPVFGLAQPATESSVEISEVRQKLQAVQESASIEPERRERLIEIYSQSLTFLESAATDREKASEYAEAIQNSPALIAEIQQQLDEPERPLPELPEDLAALEQQLLGVQTELLVLNSQLAELQAAITAEQELDLSSLLSEALAQQVVSQNQLGAPIPEDAVSLGEGTHILRAGKLAANRARVEKLQQRSLSRDARLSVWRAQQRLLSRQIGWANRKQIALQDLVNKSRQGQADQLAAQAQDRATQLDGASDTARILAEENSGLAKRVAQVTERIDFLQQQMSRLREERARVDRYYDSISQQLAVSGAQRLSDLGIELLNQRNRLAQLGSLELKLEENDEEIARAQLELLRLEDRRYLSTDETPKPESELVVQLRVEQDQLLQSAQATFRRYVSALIANRNEGRDLQRRTDEYKRLLESKLFWIPSAPQVSWQTWRGLGLELQWLFSGAQWRQVSANLLDPGLRDFVNAVVLLIIALTLLVAHRRLKQVLARQAAHIGKVQSDRAASTWIALAVSLLLALPGPLILGAMSVLVRGGEPFAQNLSVGLSHAAQLWFFLEVFRQVCRPDGLAERHFQWSDKSLSTVRYKLPWLSRILVPVALLTPLVGDSIDSMASAALTRALFTIASVALAYFALRVLRPGSSFSQSLTARHSRWQRPIRLLLYPLAVLLPLVLMALSWLGYHFTALELESKLFVSACLLVAMSLLYYLALRAIAIVERRMELERLLAKRKAEREQQTNRQAAGDAAEGLPDQLDSQEFDLQTINSQTRAFLRMVVTLITGFGLWRLWSDVLPALGGLNDIVLWSVFSQDLQIPVETVTLADLLVVGIVGFLIYFGARNLPGLLEMSVLRRFRLEQGTSYAITTMVKYIIVFTGFLVMLNLLGAQWSKLQWLVAALGVGLGFGLQEIVANFFSGILILFERPIRVGDTVTVGNHTGTVSRIRIRATTLTDWDRKEQIIPNKVFITEQLTNWSLSDSITRLIIKVGVAYGSDVQLVHQTMSEVVTANNRVIDDPPPAVFFVGFGDSSLNFEIRAFVQSILDFMPLTHELHVELEQKLRERGIVIPFPQSDVWLHTAIEGVERPEGSAETGEPGTGRNE